MASVPRVIYSAWLQGAAQAPAIVQLCFQRWARLNPEYQLHVLEASDTATFLAGEKFPPVPPQALSDILRVKLLLERGGLWVDAALFPVVPLAAWLPEQMTGTEFLAFARPEPDRPISSWCLAAAPGHIIMQKLWREIQHFWCKPRQLAAYNGGLIPPNPAASVAPEAGGGSDFYPYFWLHYLFQYLLESDAVFADSWTLCAQPAAGPPHWLQVICANAAPEEAIIAAARSAPVQKLDWHASYPLDLLTNL